MKVKVKKKRKVSINFLDRAIGYVAPMAGARRVKARAYIEVFRKYEGATKGRATVNWRANSTDANAEIEMDLETLRNRTRDHARNNPYAEKALDVLSANVIGPGIIPMSKNKTLDEAWKEWGDTTACDADGKNNFYGLQALVERSKNESGEVLVRRRRRFTSDNLPIPMQIQVLESDFLDTSKTAKLNSGNKIIQGVEFDKIGRRVAYWLFPEHPGTNSSFDIINRNQSKRIDASEILHIFRQKRPGQVRGVPVGASAVLRLKDIDEYEHAQLQKQKVAAMFAAFLTTPEAELDSEETTKMNRNLSSGSIQELPPGYKVDFGQPPTTEGYSSHMSSMLHATAIAYGVTYEAMTSDLKEVNYSSARVGWLEFQRSIVQTQDHIIIPGFCDPVWAWFVEAVRLSRGVPFRSKTNAKWSSPRREMIDPGKEVDAIRNQVRNGMISLSEAQRQQGYDSDEVIREITETNKILDKNEIILDSDPRKVNRSGNIQGAAVSAAFNSADSDDDTDDDSRYLEDENGDLWRMKDNELEKISR